MDLACYAIEIFFTTKLFLLTKFKNSYRAGDKHLDSSSDSEMDMPGMMMGSNQGGKISHNPNSVNASLSHNILLQQSQLGKFICRHGYMLFDYFFMESDTFFSIGQIPQGYSTSGNHNLHNAPSLHHPYDSMDAYQNL